LPETTRFAPSPTGRLHIGHVYSALFAARAAGKDGRFLLRIEDIDQARCRPEFDAAILEDLAWIGLQWQQPIRRQSEHVGEYRAAIEGLRDRTLLYPCFCSRREIMAEFAGAAGAPHVAGPVYPGNCRAIGAAEREARIRAGVAHAWRLDSGHAAAVAGPLEFFDRRHGRHPVDPALLGDVVLARRDLGVSYHMAVTLDDALQGVTLVTRAEDLLPATHVHRLLQALLGLPVPEYMHHRIVTDAAGERLAKRKASRSIADLRRAGSTPAEVRVLAGMPD
jgi:glutamyl-Q tRNA(Asp) synthetase